MKANVKKPETTVDSVIVSFSFPKDPLLRSRAIALVGKKKKGINAEVINNVQGELAIDIYKKLTGIDPYNK